MFESVTKTLRQISSSVSEIGIGAKFKFATIMGLQTLTVACNLAAPFLLGKGLEEVYNELSDPNEDIDFLDYHNFIYLMAFGGAVLGSRIFPSISKIISTSLKNDTAVIVNNKMNQKFSELDLNLFLTTPVGTYVHMSRQVYETQEAIPILLEELYPAALELAGGSAALLYLNWELGLGLLGIQLVTLAIAHLGTKPIKPLYAQQTREGFMLFGGLIARIQDYENIHMFGRVETELQNGLSNLKNYAVNLNKLSKTPEYVSLIENFWSTAACAGLVVLALRELSAKRLPINYFIMILIYAIQLTALLGRINKSMSQLVIAEAGMDNTNKFLVKQPTILSPKIPVKFEITDKDATIDFEKVTFQYPNEEGELVDVLKDVTFKIDAGSKTAIVGLSGAGKSTLARLLLRFYEPKEGNIYINNLDIKTIKLKTVRHIVGLVPQQPKLANGSLRDALWYANDMTTDDEMKSILSKVKLDDFATEQGLARRVGERGEKLSGGQLQRIAIARALLKEPYFFLLDEVTSALDVETAMDIQQLLDKETAGVTTLVISHQLLTITNADKIIVLDKGKVIQQGTFDELKGDTKGRFYKLLDSFCTLNNLDIKNIRGTKRPSPSKSEVEADRKYMDYDPNPLLGENEVQSMKLINEVR